MKCAKTQYTNHPHAQLDWIGLSRV